MMPAHTTSMDHIHVGKQGEKIARRYLKSLGYRVLQKNYLTRFGEIDIIAQKRDTLYFIEVKTRSTLEYGSPEEAIGRKKQERFMRAVQIYISASGRSNAFQIDAISILLRQKVRPRLWHFQDIITQ